MSTLSTLRNIQLDRTAALHAKLVDNPLRTIALDGLQRRNALLDAVFYDVGVVGPEESPDLAFWLAREGAIMIVPPSGRGQVRVFLSPEEFFQANEPVAALAVAGVGSSALGAAAFARNVADALEETVAAVVSGYGLADVLTEALGGFFWFGALNSVRHLFEPLDTVTKLFTQTEQSTSLGENAGWVRTSKDTATVIALLGDERFRPSLLVGHSKGNLVISEALYSLALERPKQAEAIAAAGRIVTISAKIGMPPMFGDVLDVMGEWDWFGGLNSRPDIKADFVVPHAWHSTNSQFPLGMGLDVKATLKRVLSSTPDLQREGPITGLAPLPDIPQLLTTTLRSGAALKLA